VAALADKYGAPNHEEAWVNSLFRSEPSRHGLALATGQLTLRDTWQTPRTTIVEIANGGKFQVTLQLRYTAKRFQAALDEEEKNEQRKVY